jgi:hypothetical protein
MSGGGGGAHRTLVHRTLVGTDRTLQLPHPLTAAKAAAGPWGGVMLETIPALMNVRLTNKRDLNGIVINPVM